MKNKCNNYISQLCIKTFISLISKSVYKKTAFTKLNNFYITRI